MKDITFYNNNQHFQLILQARKIFMKIHIIGIIDLL